VTAELTAEGGEQFLIPDGFAHGFCTLEPDTMVAYKVSAPYSPAHDSGLLWNDRDLGIAWPVRPEQAILSDKDQKLAGFSEFRSPFEYGKEG
jgi:dTDP-4-dehydrorhamnose 3,5-epimerase